MHRTFCLPCHQSISCAQPPRWKIIRIEPKMKGIKENETSTEKAKYATFISIALPNPLDSSVLLRKGGCWDSAEAPCFPFASWIASRLGRIYLSWAPKETWARTDSPWTDAGHGKKTASWLTWQVQLIAPSWLIHHWLASSYNIQCCCALLVMLCLILPASWFCDLWVGFAGCRSKKVILARGLIRFTSLFRDKDFVDCRKIFSFCNFSLKPCTMDMPLFSLPNEWILTYIPSYCQQSSAWVTLVLLLVQR